MFIYDNTASHLSLYLSPSPSPPPAPSPTSHSLSRRAMSVLQTFNRSTKSHGSRKQDYLLACLPHDFLNGSVANAPTCYVTWAQPRNVKTAWRHVTRRDTAVAEVILDLDLPNQNTTWRWQRISAETDVPLKRKDLSRRRYLDSDVTRRHITTLTTRHDVLPRYELHGGTCAFFFFFPYNAEEFIKSISWYCKTR